jgi:hypothetical protein
VNFQYSVDYQKNILHQLQGCVDVVVASVDIGADYMLSAALSQAWLSLVPLYFSDRRFHSSCSFLPCKCASRGSCPMTR